MNKPKLWNGKDLKGTWQVTLKIDGVRMLRDEDGNPVSRSGKPLYNLENIDKDITDAEVYDTDWKTSVSLVRTKHTTVKVLPDQVYTLDPLDLRLDVEEVQDPSATAIRAWLETALAQNYEGLVLRQEDKWIKVKPKETYDVQVTGKIEGTGKYIGKLGAFTTDMGNVGTGLTDKDREEYWTDTPTLIEVECMSLTPDGKFRHPVFKRVRWDK